MEKRIALSALAIMLVGVCGSVAFALSPIGPPRAMLGQDQWVVGVEYAHGEMDLEGEGKNEETAAGLGPGPTDLDHEIEDLTTDVVFASLGCGVSDNWDVFVRLGASSAEGEMTYGATGNRFPELDSSFGAAYGFGARTTFWEDGEVTWGGLFQMAWHNPDQGSATLNSTTAPILGFSGEFTGDADIDFWEIQVAVGPTVQLDTFSVYGGPFLHVLRGDLDIDVSATDGLGVVYRVQSSQDIREESQFGAFAGAHWEIGPNGTMYLEYQITGDAFGVGVGALWRTE